jgi:hypothetical protein
LPSPATTDVGVRTDSLCYFLLRLSIPFVENRRANGANGMSDVEHVRLGIVRVDGNAARVAGASTGQCE